jgi:SAM-dependent methyltransferase
VGRVAVSVNLPEWLHSTLRRTKGALDSGKGTLTIDLSGDREIEYSFIASRLPRGSGQVMDFGSGFGTLSIHALQRGWHVTGVDLLAHPIRWKHENFRFVQGDFLQLPFQAESFDVILNCSAVEHVGLPGRYDLKTLEQDGDLRAMEKMRDLLVPGGLMLLTVPAGRDSTIVPLHRVYGTQRLPKLIDGFYIDEQHFWVKDNENCWISCKRDAALEYVPTGDGTDPTRCSYALACFVLRKPAAARPPE